MLIRRLLRLLMPLVCAAAPLAAASSDTGYLFAYFYHDREGEGFRLAGSEDGYRFEMLNGGRSYLTPVVGESGLMRDPSLLRAPDGLWHLVWTTGWAGRTIGHATSRDLIAWSAQQAIPVMAHEPEAQNCWAPELIWDEHKGHFLVFWSSTILGRFPDTAMSNRRPERNHRIYATTTKDFVSFTPTRLLYDGGYNVIDANLLPAADGSGDWLMFVKDETLSPKTQKNIRLVRGRGPEGPWDPVSPPLTGNYWAEGPSAIRVDGEYRVYFDKHQLDAIGMIRSRDLRNWEDVSDGVSLPARARHGCVVAVPLAEIERLRAAAPSPLLSLADINPGAPYPECHASTLVETTAGTRVAAWFGGTKERHPDTGIWVSRREGKAWQPAVEVANGSGAEGGRQPSWNPVLFQAPGGPLMLYYKVGPSPSKWWGMVTSSTDDGRTWSPPSRLPDGILGPVKNKPVVLADGAWLSASSTEGNPEGWLVHFERSTDQGKTWRRIGPVGQGPGFDAIQPSVLFHEGGRLQALCRSRQGAVVQTWSPDGGLTWSPLTATEVPNPNSGTDAVTLADGRQLLVYNPTAHRPNEAKGNRWPLAVAVSDDGLAWRRVLTLDSEPKPSGYAYPAVIQTRDGRVEITYTWDRKRIRHAVLDPALLR
jgi:predicted neuraminidase